jgi:hypothetical protein
MRRLRLLVMLLVFAGAALAQSTGFAPEGQESLSAPQLVATVSLPLMSPDLALATYQRHAAQQAHDLGGYSAATVVRAELPGSSQKGEFYLERYFRAPRSLTFKSLRYMGDAFVKTNVIARLLQSEVDHVEKDDPTGTAIVAENYRISHKSTSESGEHTVHVYQVKPRKKRPGLFKGHIELDARTGSLVRASGQVVKSPSVFVSRIEFVQEFADVNGFTLPVHLHTEAKARLIGKTVVDIENRDYQPMPAIIAIGTTGSE